MLLFSCKREMFMVNMLSSGPEGLYVGNPVVGIAILAS